MEPIDGTVTVAILVIYLASTLGLAVVLTELLKQLKDHGK